MEIYSVREFVQPAENVDSKVPLHDGMRLAGVNYDMPFQSPLVAPLTAPPPAVIKVVGTGGGGSNAVNRMIEGGLSGVQFIAVNTDIQDLNVKSKAPIKLQIGSKLTGGRGAGGIPERGEAAAKEDYEMITEVLRGADMVFVTCCMGGGTGTGSAPVIAKIAHELGALTVGVVTKPFEYEMPKRMRIAEEGIKKLREVVDSLIVIPNELMFKVIDRNTPFTEALLKVDDVLRQGVQGISDLITKPGEINVDFADVEATMKGQGDALMGIGIGTGNERAKEAASNAIDNPLLEDTTIEGATKLLVNIAVAGPDNFSPFELKDIMLIAKAKTDPEVEIIHGVTFDPSLGENIKVTVIATGFKNKNAAEIRRTEGKNTESDTFIDFGRFQKMKGQAPKHSNDGYSGFLKSNDYVNLDVPTALRRHNFGGDIQAGKAAVGGAAAGGREN